MTRYRHLRKSKYGAVLRERQRDCGLDSVYRISRRDQVFVPLLRQDDFNAAGGLRERRDRYWQAIIKG